MSLPLPHRLDIKPNVFLGLNWPECMYAFAIASICSIGAGLVIGFMIGDLKIALPVWIGLGMFLFWVFGSFMAKFKHNRPFGYYQQKIYLALQYLGFGRWYITQSGYRDPRLLNCDYSPEALEKMRFETLLIKQSMPVPAIERNDGDVTE